MPNASLPRTDVQRVPWRRSTLLAHWSFACVSDAWNACPAEPFRLTFIQLTPHFGGHRLLLPILAFTILQDFCDPDPERGHGLRRQMIMISEGGEKQTAPSRWSR
jgi:hypothetical protein